MTDWLTTIGSILIGGLLTFGSSYFADRRLTDRERERRREERRERSLTRSNDFQRETLLALQVASQKLMRTTGAMHHQDVLAFRETGQWQRQLFRDDLSDESLRQNTETLLMASRIRDDEVRALADRLREDVSAVTISKSKNESESRLMAAASTHVALIKRIGLLVREMDTISESPE